MLALGSLFTKVQLELHRNHLQNYLLSPRLQSIHLFIPRHDTMGSMCETVPAVAMRSEAPARHELLVSSVRPLISNFLETIDYTPPQNTDRGALRACMLEYAAKSGVPYNEDKHARQCFVTGLSVASVRAKILPPIPHITHPCSPIGLYIARNTQLTPMPPF